MKIIKLHKSVHGHFYALLDEKPELTYEKVGNNYIGSVINEDGSIVFSEYLSYSSWGGAFGGRELQLKMKDGSVNTIKDHWWDRGYCRSHGECLSIGAATLEESQKCYVYYGMNINKAVFENMLNDYFSREKLYDYYEIKDWCLLQHTWYDVIISGKKYPYMVNKFGDFVHRETKKPISVRHNKCIWRYKKKCDKTFDLCLFKLEYKEGDRLIKLERKMLDVLKESLPFSIEEIKRNCKL